MSSGTAPTGCADASLYRRFYKAGLVDVKIFPQLVAFTYPRRLAGYEAELLPTLRPEEVRAWRMAKARAESEGTLYMAQPFHCAVGTRPSSSYVNS